MMKFLAYALLILGAGPCFGSAMGYGQSDCVVHKESRGDLGSQEVCMQEVNCKNFPLPSPDQYNYVDFVAYCRPSAGGRCPVDGLRCIQDTSITSQDVTKIRMRSSGPECNCGIPTESGWPTAPSGVSND